MPKKRKTDGYSERLQLALEVGPEAMSVRQLARAVADKYPDLRGASYAGVRQYVEGNVRSPRVELLRAMADVLGVRPEWLAHNDGAMTAAEEEARKRPPLAPTPAQMQRTRTAAYAAFRDEAGVLFPSGFDAAQAQVLLAVGAVAEYVGPGGLDLPGMDDEEGEQPGHRRYVEAARLLGRAIMAPLHVLRIEPQYWTQGAKAQYLAHALATYSTMVELEHGLGALVRAMHANRPDPSDPPRGSGKPVMFTRHEEG
jgi:transcriptional regulator with XRE-family HTH domain